MLHEQRFKRKTTIMNSIKKLQDRIEDTAIDVQKIHETLTKKHFRVLTHSFHCFFYHKYNLGDRPRAEQKDDYNKAIASVVTMKDLLKDLGFTNKELVTIDQKAHDFVWGYLQDKIEKSNAN